VIGAAASGPGAGRAVALVAAMALAAAIVPRAAEAAAPPAATQMGRTTARELGRQVAWRPPIAFRSAAADRALLERVLAGSRVERRPEPPDASYLRDLVARLYSSLAELLDQASQRLRLPRWLLPGVVAALGTAAVALLAWAGWRRRPRRAAAGDERKDGGGAAAAAAAGGDRQAAESGRWDAAAWRLELERRLAQGSVQEALRATWWWLARSLAGASAEPTWTGRELLRRSGREDLESLVRQLDVMVYGPRRPGTEEVERLAARLEAALA
jgi:hypothetical protein